MRHSHTWRARFNIIIKRMTLFDFDALHMGNWTFLFVRSFMPKGIQSKWHSHKVHGFSMLMTKKTGKMFNPWQKVISVYFHTFCWLLLLLFFFSSSSFELISFVGVLGCAMCVCHFYISDFIHFCFFSTFL